MERSQILKKLESIENLPTLPSVALTVNKMLKDYNTPMDELVALLEKDQSLVMKILRLVNSSFFGFKCKVSSIGHAVTLLGFSTVQNAVVTVSVIESLSVGQNAGGFAIEKFWEHSISVAMMSRFIAVHTKLSSPEDAFTAGLLHDIGKIIWVNFFPDTFCDIHERMQAENLDFVSAEKSLGVPTHGVIGSVLAKRWLLPEGMVDSIKRHHSGPERRASDYLTHVISISDSIYHMMNGDEHSTLALEKFDDTVRSATIGLFQAHPDWIKDIKQEIAGACELLKLEVA